MQNYPNNIENYQIITIQGYTYESLGSLIKKLNDKINHHLNNGAILIGGPIITQGRSYTDHDIIFSVAQAIAYPKKQENVNLLDIDNKM